MPAIPNHPEEDLVPETLVPRLGEYLLEKGLITSRELQQALDYQKKKAASGQPRLIGRALMELGYIDRETLEKVVITQVFSLHTALEEANQQLEQRVQQRTQDLENRLVQIRTTAEIAQVAISARSMDEMLRRTVELIVQRMQYDHAAVFLLDDTGKFAVLHAATGPIGQVQNPGDYRLPVGSPSVIGWVCANNLIKIISEANQENLFFKGDLLPNVRTEAGIPIALGDGMLGLLHIQHSRSGVFDSDNLATLQTVANLLASLIQNYHLLETTQQNLKVMEKRLVVLETLDLVNKTISAETNLNNLYELVHEQIVKVMGDVDFLIALHDPNTNTIEVPYAFETGRRMTMPSYPRGKGLTSLLIKSKQAIRLVEDVEHRAVELGAKVFGKPAKSWLGAPLLVGGDAIGAIVVQDFEREHRFDEDDQRLLSNLATQVAITVRNAFQLENTRRQAERERLGSEITAKLWASTDLHTILRTAIQELGQKLEASEGTVYLQTPGSSEIVASSGNNGNKEGSS
jgi:GAF domain-containing protein